MRDVVNDSAVGCSAVPITGHDPLANNFSEPVNLQLVGTDGAGTHAVATLGGLIFDAAEAQERCCFRAQHSITASARS